VKDAIARSTEARESVRTGRLLDDVRAAEARAEHLYETTQDILNGALKSKDRRTALQAIRAAVDVMGEAKGYLELRGELTGELGRDKTPPSFAIQIVIPSTSGDPANVPRISYAAADQIDDDVVDLAVVKHG
jgi:hypothetical protein